MIRRDLVPAHKYLEGDAVTIRCAHGDVTLYPLTDVEMEVDGLPIKVEAAVSEKLPMGVLLGTDVPELSTLLGTEVRLTDGNDDVMVVTRAQARRQLEEEILRREKEIRSGAKPTSLEDSGEPRASGAQDGPEPSSTGEGLTKKQRRSLQQQLHQSKVQNSDAL